MPTFANGQKIGEYTVKNLIKANRYTETYRVEDQEQTPLFLKAFILKDVPTKLLNGQTGNILEIENVSKLRHKNILTYIGQDVIDTEVGRVQYYVTNYLNGELLSERIRREGKLDHKTAREIFMAVIDGLQYMHEQGLLHNDITPRNIMLSSTPGVEPQIIDFGHVSAPTRSVVSFDVTDLEYEYLANETFIGEYDTNTDVFAAAAVYYTMLTGHAPWSEFDIPDGSRGYVAMQVKEYRKQNPLDIDSVTTNSADNMVLRKGLSLSSTTRPSTMAMLREMLDIKDKPTGAERSSSDRSPAERTDPKCDDGGSSGFDSNDPENVEFAIHRGNGNGFADIAGMQSLKDYLNQKVIFILKNKEIAESYRLHAPNAMLLYGPPGCGKTFVAEKFAEETGFNYMLVKASDLGSTLVHGAQQKIAKLFKRAAAAAPIVICFDEFDAMVPVRGSHGSEYQASEVNEFLAQLNNCSAKGIFVVATTNRPDHIDPAVLRTGRIDKRVYVPMPDHDARREMFVMHMNNRPGFDQGIDYDELASCTEGYIASDIAFIVNDAALVAAYNKENITHDALVSIIKGTHPSLRKEIIKEYEDMRDDMETYDRSSLSNRRTVGFDTSNM